MRSMPIANTTDRKQRSESGSPFKFALVHDWLTGMRGGEKVLDLICQRYPDAPLYTLLHLKGTVNENISSRSIHTSLLQKMPRVATKYRSYLPLFPLFAELNKADDADIVISTSHAVAKSMVKRGGKKKPYHICYIHTPMRYAWDMFDDYFGADRVGWFASRFVFRPVVEMLRFYDKSTVGRVDLFIANSTYVAERVQRLYGREAEVIAPPVDTKRFADAVRDRQDWYLVVSAMVPYKRVDHAIRACKALGRPLKIVGKGPERAALVQLARELDADVEFIGFATDEELVDYYRHAKALLFPGVEDFGIVPVEAIACGCPVVALGVGGVLDSMTEDTAVFYTEPTIQGLTDAVQRYEANMDNFAEGTLRTQADNFSEATFLHRLNETLLRVERQLASAEDAANLRGLLPSTAD